MPRLALASALISLLTAATTTMPTLAFLVPRPSSLPSPSALSAGPQQADGAIRVKNVPEKREWVPLLKANEIAPGDMIPLDTNGLSLLLAADKDGTVYCTASCSPFMSAPLSDGRLQDGCVICPQSGSAFSLQTGELVGEWCPFPPLLGPLIGKLYEARDLAVFPVRAKGNMIEAYINVNLKAEFESKYWAGLLDAQGKATGDYY